MVAKHQKNEKPWVIRDEIHGDIGFDPIVRRVIDHASFQRLRRIRQLGLAEYVFPCATHTRFQHSLGAAYLAGECFESLLVNWLSTPFEFDGKTGGTKFFARNTLEAVASVVEDEASYEFWHRAVTLAGLLHDLGHGPWSHTFELLDLRQDFSKNLAPLKGAIAHYFQDIQKRGDKFHHEDLSILYLFHILSDLGGRDLFPDWELYFLPVASLIKNKMGEGVENEMAAALKKGGIKGGVEFHRLLRPIISGPFDADRMDYIQRDGRNCGVHIAGIEWRRIVSKLLPCLAEHQGQKGEPTGIVLVSNLKNQHVLDDFIFTLFQMYAQVYLHPKIVGLEEAIRKLILKKGYPSPKWAVTLETHQSLTDEKFKELLTGEFKLPEIDKLLQREVGNSVEAVRFPMGKDIEKTLTASRFEFVPHLDRPLMKDSVGVFLFSPLNDEVRPEFVRTWQEISPIANQFYTMNYSPNIWIRSSN